MIPEKQWYYDRADWQEKISIIPRRCDISNQWIWGRHYRGTVIITGPGDPVIVNFWNHRDHHLLYKLKGEL